MKRTVLAAFAAAVALGGGAPAGAEVNNDQALTELVQILHREGVLDEGQLNELTAKAAKAEVKESWTDRISLWGDLRGRYEGFYYVEDDADIRNRVRLRYRFRLNGKADINSRAQVFFTVASGGDDNRSTNQTLGDGPDFASDPIRIDRAYFRLSPFADGLLPDESGTVWTEFGKVPNPYVWKYGKDFMLWDNDISLEGVNFLFEDDVTDHINLFANTGYYVVDEEGASGDPNLFAAQLGSHVSVTDEIRFGGRVSYFRFGNVSMSEIQTGVDGNGGGGNIIDGMTNGDSLNVIEGGFYSQFDCLEDWPITIYGNIAKNLSAVSSSLFPQAEKENLAWGVGAEIGNSKEWVKIGAGWFQIEANAFFSQFIDSDLFDGVTNRKGVAVYASRELLPGVEMALTTFWSRPIDDSLPAFENSVPKAYRVRVQADMQFKF